jgi:WD40 repeat protein
MLHSKTLKWLLTAWIGAACFYGLHGLLDPPEFVPVVHISGPMIFPGSVRPHPYVFSPDGKIFAFVNKEGDICTVSLIGNHERKVIRPVSTWIGDLSFSRDGRTLIAVDTHGKPGLWDMEKQQEGSFAGYGSYVRTQREHVMFCRAPSATASVWDIVTNKRIDLVNEKGFLSGKAIAIALSHDGNHLAMTGLHGVTVFDTRTGKPEASISAAYNFDFTPDSSSLVFSTGFWGTPETVRTVRWHLKDNRALDGQIPELLYDFSADGKVMVTAGNHSFTVWDAATWQPIAVIRDPSIISFTLSADGRRLAAACRGHKDGLSLWWAQRWGPPEQSRVVKLYDTTAPGHILLLPGIRPVLSPDGSAVATGDMDGIRIWTIPPKVAYGRTIGCAALAAAPAFLGIFWGARRILRRRRVARESSFGDPGGHSAGAGF